MSEVMEQLIREVNIENQKAFDELTIKMELEKAKAEAAEEKLLNYKRAFKLSNDMRRMGIPESEISRSIEEAFGIAA